MGLIILDTDAPLCQHLLSTGLSFLHGLVHDALERSVGHRLVLSLALLSPPIPLWSRSLSVHCCKWSGHLQLTASLNPCSETLQVWFSSSLALPCELQSRFIDICSRLPRCCWDCLNGW